MSNFDLQSLEKLLYDFYNLTNIKTCLYDSEGNEICYYPKKFSAFCDILRKNEAIDQRCKDCDKIAFANCRKTRSQYVYTCHAGLYECISPIIYNNHIIGFIMLGQIKSNDKTDFANLEKDFSVPLQKKLRTAYDSLPNISKEKILSAFRILDACTGYELFKTLIHIHENSIDRQIDKYIRENLSMPLSVPHLCFEFHLSRYELYNTCNEYFGCTPAEYIKKCRLAHACKLLTTTNLPVHKIAMQCGIPDYNYFSKVFKSSYGICPSKYKECQNLPKS